MRKRIEETKVENDDLSDEDDKGLNYYRCILVSFGRFSTKQVICLRHQLSIQIICSKDKDSKGFKKELRYRGRSPALPSPYHGRQHVIDRYKYAVFLTAEIFPVSPLDRLRFSFARINTIPAFRLVRTDQGVPYNSTPRISDS